MRSACFRLFVFAVCMLLFACTGTSLFARQVQPAAKKPAAKTAALSTAHCSSKSGDCCKGTPTRLAVLASTVGRQPKPVKSK